MRTLLLASIAALVMSSSASDGATLKGFWQVTALNLQGMSGADSEALFDDFADATFNASGQWANDTFFYRGRLDFGTSKTDNSTTIAEWLGTGGGTVSGLDPSVADLQLSAPGIDTGTATTTFFLFDYIGGNPINAPTFEIDHDDGVGVYTNALNTYLGGTPGPTGLTTTTVTGYQTGEELFILYVATNGDPSILRVSAIPLPAALPLLLVGLGGLGCIRARRR